MEYLVGNLKLFYWIEEKKNTFSFSEFAKEKDKVEGRALFLRLKYEKQLDDELSNYVDWIFSAGKPSV